jgi:hypothetical protein
VLLTYAGRGTPEAPPFIELKGTAATVRGVIVAYPEWRREDVPPVPYPPTIGAGRVDNVAVLDCLLLNPYEAVTFEGTGRFLIRNVYGYPSSRGIFVDRCMDIGRIENVHFWPFGVPYIVGDPYTDWINLNGVAFDFGQTDWQIVQGSFCFGYGIGYRFRRASGVFCGKLVATSADCCQTPIKVEANGHILISEGEFVGRWGSSDSVCVDIGEESAGKVSLMNCAFWGPIYRVVHTRADRGSLSVIGCDIRNWNEAAGAIAVEGGKAIIQSNTFTKPGLNVLVGSEVKSAIITGNQAVPGLRVENHAGDRCVLMANEEDSFTWPTAASRRHYRIDVGDPGDFRYVSFAWGWNGCEPALEWEDDSGTKRWSQGTSQIRVPVEPGLSYALTLDAYVPEFAVMDDGGLYAPDGTRLVALDRPGHVRGEAVVTAGEEEEVLTLELRCRPWYPNRLPGTTSRDGRELGVAVRSLDLKAEGADTSAGLLNACSGLFIDQP